MRSKSSIIRLSPLLAPESRRHDHQQGEDLEATEEHGEGAHPGLEVAQTTAKLVAGPTSPRPGPVLLMLATTAEKAVMISSPEKESAAS
jgi:hypothetical protein